MSFLNTLLSSKAAKAWVAAFIAAGGAIATAVTDQSITAEEIGLAIGLFLGALGVTFRVPNAKDDVN